MLLFWNLNILHWKLLTWLWETQKTVFALNFFQGILSQWVWKGNWEVATCDAEPTAASGCTNTNHHPGALQPNILAQHFRGTPKHASSSPDSPACPECGCTCVHHMVRRDSGGRGDSMNPSWILQYNIIIQLQLWLEEQVFLRVSDREGGSNDMVGASMKCSNPEPGLNSIKIKHFLWWCACALVFFLLWL